MFDNPHTANELIKMIAFVCNLSAIFLNLYEKPLVGQLFKFMPFFPYWSFVLVNNLQDKGGFKAVASRDSEIYTFRNGNIIWLFLQLGLFPLLFYYLKHTIRNEKDNRRNWFFFLRRSQAKQSRTLDDSSNKTLKRLIKERANRDPACTANQTSTWPWISTPAKSPVRCPTSTCPRIRT